MSHLKILTEPVAFVAILLYDHVLTFGDEVKLELSSHAVLVISSDYHT